MSDMSEKTLASKTVSALTLIILLFTFCVKPYAFALEDASANVSPYASNAQQASAFPSSPEPYSNVYASAGGSPDPYGNNPYDPNMMSYPQPPPPPYQNQIQQSEVIAEPSYSSYSPYYQAEGMGSDYTLGVDDVVTVIVRNQPEFSGRFAVNPEGNIQYNYIGDIKAEGRTKDELKIAIEKSLTRYVRNPEVAVMVTDFKSKSVYVFGYVKSPGKKSMTGDHMTIKEAIVAAGLPREDAAMKQVYVIRPSQYTASGKPEKRSVNLKRLLHKGDSSENFVLRPGDTIYIRQKFFDKFINTYSRLITPIFQTAALYSLANRISDKDGDGGLFKKKRNNDSNNNQQQQQQQQPQAQTPTTPTDPNAPPTTPTDPNAPPATPTDPNTPPATPSDPTPPPPPPSDPTPPPPTDPVPPPATPSDPTPPPPPPPSDPVPPPPEAPIDPTPPPPVDSGPGNNGNGNGNGIGNGNGNGNGLEG
jgi:protein involved in polysaccharide export with SLBB domain